MFRFVIFVFGQQVNESVQVGIVKQPTIPVSIFALVAEDVFYRHPGSLEDIFILVQKY